MVRVNPLVFVVFIGGLLIGAGIGKWGGQRYVEHKAPEVPAEVIRVVPPTPEDDVIVSVYRRDKKTGRVDWHKEFIIESPQERVLVLTWGITVDRTVKVTVTPGE